MKEYYTPEEVKKYTEELKNLVETDHHYYTKIDHKLKYLNDFIDWVTRDKLSGWNYNRPTKIYWIIHGLTEFPKCVYCGKVLSEKNIYNIFRGYHPYCCSSCAAKDSVDKVKKTKFEHYGDANYCNTAKIKQTKLERYGDVNYCNKEKMRLTNIERYGGVAPACSMEVVEK